MHIRQVHVQRYKRFTELTVELPEPARLVMMCGPNGTGKSSLLEAMKLWHDVTSNELGRGGDETYHIKGDWTGQGDWAQQVTVELHEQPVSPNELHKVVYFRTAYRHEPEFALGQITKTPLSLLTNRPGRMIDHDVRVSGNYQQLVGQSLDAWYSETDENVRAIELRERLIGALSRALLRVLPDLELKGLVNPTSSGTFRFKKGTVTDFPYAVLSGGEKAVFDLLLDLSLKTPLLKAPIVCIDEPEAHTNPLVQGTLLDALLDIAGADSQLWLATHSVGMLRRARKLSDEAPGSVAFLDFGERDFDEPQSLAPVSLSRTFWKRTIATSIGDIADLVAPSTVVLCEGQPSTGHRAEFDARCLRTIFEDSEPEADFVAVGNDRQVIADEAGAGQAIQAVVPGATVVRLIDRDDRSDAEVRALREEGVTPLSRRNLESYLLDEEVLEALCIEEGKGDRWPALQQARNDAHNASVERGNRADDWKSTRGAVFNACKELLGLERAGSSADGFLLERLAPRIRPGMAVYDELRHDVFE
jgi:energy-coupling factor transporter ATP-binding protein EcfA2